MIGTSPGGCTLVPQRMSHMLLFGNVADVRRVQRGTCVRERTAHAYGARHTDVRTQILVVTSQGRGK